MIEMTEAAAKKIRYALEQQGLVGGGMRVGIKAGGCSGLSYIFSWQREPREGDKVFEGPEGARIFVDQKSYAYLKGTVLDFDTNLISKGFIFNNPNAKGTCGCGTSFGV